MPVNTRLDKIWDNHTSMCMYPICKGKQQDNQIQQGQITCTIQLCAVGLIQ